jgi:N utilization substance protein A
MNKIVFDTDLMKIIAMFESITHTNVKDCISEPDRLIFIVNENQVSKAVGKNGANVRRMEQALKRKLKIVEFNSDGQQFTRNLIYPLKAKDVQEHDGIIVITSPDSQTRGYLIGRNAKQLRGYEAIIKRHFPIKEVKVE